MLNIKQEQRVNVKFLAKLGKSATETYAMVKEVYGSECLSRSRVFEWYKKFKGGWEDIEDGPRGGRPRTSCTSSNVEKVSAVLHENPNLSIRAISKLLDISKESVRKIILNEHIREKNVAVKTGMGSKSGNAVVNKKAAAAKKKKKTTVKKKPCKKGKSDLLSQEVNEPPLEEETATLHPTAENSCDGTWIDVGRYQEGYYSFAGQEEKGGDNI